MARKPTIVRCIRGHPLRPGEQSHYCWKCQQADERARESMPAAQYREHRRQELGLGPAPDVMTMQTGDGQLISFKAGPRRRR